MPVARTEPRLLRAVRHRRRPASPVWRPPERAAQACAPQRRHGAHLFAEQLRVHLLHAQTLDVAFVEQHQRARAVRAQRFKTLLVLLQLVPAQEATQLKVLVSDAQAGGVV